jgi:hypothetical protein
MIEKTNLIDELDAARRTAPEDLVGLLSRARAALRAVRDVLDASEAGGGDERFHRVLRAALAAGESAAPTITLTYGNGEVGTALTVTVFSEEPRYQARLWRDGDTGDLKYFLTFEECVGWFGALPVDQEFDGPEEEAPRATGLLPQLGPWGWSYALGDEKEFETWWEGSDLPEAKRKGPIWFRDMKED